MSVLPFSDFLELLRAKGLGVSLHEHLAVGRLLERWESTNREEFRDAIAALVARHEGEVLAIRELFDEFYPAFTEAEVDVAVDQEPSARREYRGVQLLRNGRSWAAAVALVVLATALAFTYRYYAVLDIPRLPAAPSLTSAGPRPPQPPQIATQAIPEASIPDALVQVVPEPPATALQPPPSRVNWPLVIALSAAALGVSLLAFWGARVRASARQWTLDAWQTALASLPGPYHARLVMKDLVTRLSRRDIEDAATLLARAFSGSGRGRELDVPRSLRETLRSGLRPQLVFRPRRVQQTILVLHDVSQVMEPHEARIESFLVDLRRQGIVIERWYFDGDVSIASHRRDGPPVPLEVLAKRREDWPLMVLSSGLGVTATLTLPSRAWMNAFRTWTRRVWLSPIRDTQLWPAAVQRLPMRVLPMTRSGLLEAAIILAQGEHAAAGVVDRSRQTTRSVTIEHVEQMKRLASVVPYPTIAELELLRQRFAPDVPESAVLHAANDIGSYAGAPLRMSDGEIRDHLRQLRKETPALETEVRRYLMKVLTDSEPVAGSAAHLRWEVSMAIHQLQLAELTSGDHRPVVAALSALAKGPLWKELRDAVERLAPSGARSSDVRKAVGLQGPATEPPAFQDGSGQLELPPLRRLAPRWQDFALAGAVALMVAMVGSFSGPFRLQASHALDAYTLEYRISPATSDAGELRIFTRDQDSPVPQSVRLYRDTTPVGEAIDLDPRLGASVPLAADTEPHVYQVRAPLPGGALALSNTLWAPSVLISVDAQPWARVTVRSQGGRVPELTQVTPAVFRLPEGTYDLSLENGGLTAPLTQRIQVSSAGQRIFRYDMPSFDPAQLLNQLGLAGQRPAAAK